MKSDIPAIGGLHQMIEHEPRKQKLESDLEVIQKKISQRTRATQLSDSQGD